MRDNPFRKIYALDEYQNAYKLPLREFPFIIDVEACNRCNLNCVMCTHQLMSRSTGAMSIDTLRLIVLEATKHGCRGVRFILYGEPLLNPALFQMVNYAHRRGLLTHVTTNGLYLNKWRVDALLKSGLDSLIISFQGTDRAGYEEMRGPSYSKLMANLDYYFGLNTTRPFTTITTTMLDDTPEQIAAFKEYWLRDADAVDVWETYLEPVKNIDRVKPFLTRQRLSPRNAGPCNELYTKLNCLWDGSVTACCDISNINNALHVGTFPVNTLKDIWHGEALQNIRKNQSSIPLCQHCHRKF